MSPQTPECRMGRGLPAWERGGGRKGRKGESRYDVIHPSSHFLPPLTRMYGKAKAAVKLANQVAVFAMATAFGRAS